jgi:hypothetical protein
MNETEWYVRVYPSRLQFNWMAYQERRMVQRSKPHSSSLLGYVQSFFVHTFTAVCRVVDGPRRSAFGGYFSQGTCATQSHWSNLSDSHSVFQIKKAASHLADVSVQGEPAVAVLVDDTVQEVFQEGLESLELDVEGRALVEQSSITGMSWLSL